MSVLKADGATPAPRILCAGHDPGGLNLIAAALRAWTASGALSPVFLGTPQSARAIAATLAHVPLSPLNAQVSDACGIAPYLLSGPQPELVAEISSYSAVFTATSHRCPLERQVLRLARQCGIPSFTICDMWWAYSERFRDADGLTAPDELFALDERMLSEMRGEGDLPATITIVGNPMYDELLGRRSKWPHPTTNIRFISEPASDLFASSRVDERRIARMVLDAVRDVGDPYRLLVRPHPKEPVSKWQEWIAANGGDASLDITPVAEVLASVDRGIGISSILLTQMALCGIPVAAVQPPEADPEYYCLPFQDFGIPRLTTVKEIGEFIQRALVSPQLSPAVFNHRGAMDRITERILAAIAARQTGP